jgi:peroxiredoxin
LPLSKINTASKAMVEKSLYVNPHILIVKDVNGVFFNSLGIEFGCKTYVFPSMWRYGAVSDVPEVPKASAFHPYVSIFIGFNSNSLK